MPLRHLLLPLLVVGIPLVAHAGEQPTALEAVRQGLPAYSEEEHARAVAQEEARVAEEAAALAAGESDPNLVILPDMTVMEKALQRMEEDSLYRKGAYDKELIKRELSAFDRDFLNRFTIPLLGVSNAARAREAAMARRNAALQDRMSRLNRLVALVDGDEAREFREVLRDASLANGNAAKEAARATSARGGSGGINSQ